jgi:tetratricopeptide (TPR) repeat protein
MAAWRERLIFPLLAALLALLAYLPFLQRDLIWDSRPLIMENGLLRGGVSPLEPFRHGWWQTTSQGSDGRSDYYRPLTVLSFMAEKAAWGLSPWRLRLVNLLLLVAALFALHRFLLRHDAPPGAAGIAVLLFALFPLHADNVNWVVGRCDLLMLLFGIVSLLLFDMFLQGKSPWAGFLSATAFALALLSKEAALFFLPMFPLHEFIRRRRVTLPPQLLPLLAAAGFWLLRSAVTGRGGFPLQLFPNAADNALSALGALGYYGRSLAFPFAADTFLPADAVRSVSWLAAGVAAALVLFLAPAVALKSPGPSRDRLLVAWAWAAPFLVGAVLMVFTPVYPPCLSTRYLAVPAVGWCWWLGCRLAALRPALKRGALLVLLAAAATAIAAGSQKYRDEAAFWRSALASSPGDGFFLTQYARQLKEGGDFIRAGRLLRRALAGRLKNPTAVVIAQQSAEMAFAQARYAAALSWLERMRALRLDRLAARLRLMLLLRVRTALNDRAGADAALREMDLACPAAEAVAGRRLTRLAFADFSGAAPGAEAGFRSLSPARRARYFIDRGNYAAAWESWPDKESPGIAVRLQTARLALLAGREQEAQHRLSLLAGENAGDHRVLNSIGNLLFDLKRAEEALPLYRRSLRLAHGQEALRSRADRIERAAGNDD